jgi:hypothetical protein
MNYEIKLLNKEEDLKKYDQIVDLSKHGTIFHKYSFLKKIYLSYNIKFYGIFFDNKLIGGFPVPFYKKKMIKSPPLVPYLGVFYCNLTFLKKYKINTFEKELNNYLCSIFKSVIYVGYPLTIHHKDILPFIWSGVDYSVKYTYCVDLTKNENEILSNFSNSVIRQIRKNKEKDIQVVEDDINSFLKANKNSFLKKKLNVKFDFYWKKIFETLKNKNVKIFTLKKNKIDSASIFLIWDNKQVYYLGGGINKNSSNEMAYLFYKSIIYFKNKNIPLFNFEGSLIPSIENYFRKFGGDLYPIFVIKKSNFLINFIKKFK